MKSVLKPAVIRNRNPWDVVETIIQKCIPLIKVKARVVVSWTSYRHGYASGERTQGVIFSCNTSVGQILIDEGDHELRPVMLDEVRNIEILSDKGNKTAQR